MGSQATARLALASSVRERWRVPPLLALVLVAAIGLLVTGRPWPRLGPGPWLDRVLAAGAPPPLLGLLPGPRPRVPDPPAPRPHAPLAAPGVGWVGAGFGARFGGRSLR